MMPTFQTESKEFLPVPITVGGLPHTTGLSFAVVPQGSRPVMFTNSVTVDGEVGTMVGPGLPGGPYDVFASISDVAPQAPVLWCGRIAIVSQT